MSDLPVPLRRATAVTRSIDLSAASNRFALFITAVTFVGVLLAELIVGDGGGAAAIAHALRGGAGVFLSWAIARELDPDRTRTARYAAFGGIAALVIGGPGVAALGAVLLGARVAARSTGLVPTTVDLVGLVVLAWFAAGDSIGVVAAFGLAAALVWDTRLPVRAPRSSGLAGAIVLSTAVVAAIVGGALFADWRGPTILEAAVLLVAMAAATQLGAPNVNSHADVTGEPLHEARVRAARQLTVAILTGSVVWAGGPAVAALGGAWSAVIATGVVRWRRSRLTAATAAALALLLGACSPDAAPAPAPTTPPAATSPAPAPAPTSSPTPGGDPARPEAPQVHEYDTPEELAADLLLAELVIRDDTATDHEIAGWAHVQQAAYRQLAERDGWTPQVREAFPSDLRPAFDLNARAQAELHALTRPRDELPDHWTIVAPPAADELMAAYRTAAEEFGVDWTYLAAIHLIETRMGRIRGDSTAGARGPMQFLPSTWEAYGQGDIEDPTDAIRAAARYLVAHGAPADMDDALWAYNHSDHYVRAVTDYAQVMQAEPETYRAYHAWRVYYRLTTGSVVLDEGWSGGDT